MLERKEQPTTSAPFKFKELKVYNSTEYLWGNHKKYRQVFDRYETAYIYAELSVFNKRFDESDWSLRVNLKCYRVREKEKSEVCSLTVDKEVSKFDAVVHLREGWGNQKKGTFWKAGTYFWEAYIDGQRVGSKYFYIIQSQNGPPDADDNPGPGKPRICDDYLELTSVKLYEGPYDDVTVDDRVYLKAFASQDTRYVYLELEFRNKQTEYPWQLELFTKFVNESRELKGHIARLQQVDAGQEIIKLTAGWGAANPNLWRENAYTADIIFLDSLLVSVPFTVGDEAQPGFPSVVLPGKKRGMILNPEVEQDATFEDIMVRLDALIGLQEVKQQLRDHAVYIQFQQLRQERGFAMDTGIEVHSVFSGNPGTGKTTVARMMGKLYKKMGLLSRGHTVVADRVDLVGEYIGQTAPKTREVIESARGGVLFIDEAYALARSNDDGKDFGREVIEILVKEMSNGAGDLAVVVAGYTEEMKRFLDSNTGLKSRFKHHFEFRNFLPQELSRIADYAARQLGVTPTLEAKALIDETITLAFRNRDRTFGNARYVHDLLEKAKVQMALRLMRSDESGVSHSNDALSTIELQDVVAIKSVLKAERPAIPVNEQLLKAALAELDELVGMENVKGQLHELVRLVRYYRKTGRDVLNAFHLHTVLVGNPGTGKTTIARILALLYSALGILERGHIIETDRQGLVAGYVGQTAEKTAKVIEKAIGGVLFIDEAYALTQTKTSQRGDFGDEAIQTLLKRMEDQRGQFYVCVAGYPDNMDSFLKANPGLSSRFDKILRFEDYSPAQLSEIADRMFRQQKAQLTPSARTHLTRYLEFLYKFRDAYFGNARTVRQLVIDIMRRHDLRKAEQASTTGKGGTLRILKVDVEHLKLDTKELSIQRKRIGF
ncbi:Holliday junction ATP-dependent DNA helicase RuvB [Neolewinella maritima]|uniref:Holliday junction ATP-dependent DNA helicase RuvB n=1 Tax=Neolewinella maritima TaxID=1383882 RepID=A0ABM9AZQ6_9BACT|nr:AAA family ATPase [Neolewinella maritima]CAH1000281.1 Holliday junction ATP-dependent DNA helicase RuvB [Neolewinella maritima]